MTAQATDGSGISASFPVTVYPAASYVQICDARTGRVMNNRTVTVYLSENAGMELDALVYPLGAEGARTGVTFSCSSKAATISADGQITFLKKGTATIKATATDGSNVFASFIITIK